MKPSMVRFGPCAVAGAPVAAFSKLRGGVLEQAWHIVGPSAERNLARGPAWAAIAAAYLEGLQHGSNAALTNAAQPGDTP